MDTNESGVRAFDRMLSAQKKEKEHEKLLAAASDIAITKSTSAKKKLFHLPS